MNYFGSYKALLGNSKAAMFAAIEIYNKPHFSYRDECFVILLINAWELLAKAILSKNRYRIYYKKKRNRPYKTLSLWHAMKAAKNYFPEAIQYLPVSRNISKLVEYRDNAVHFYNQPDFGVLVYSLAQVCILNYKDLLFEVFEQDITEESTLALLPLGFGSMPDPVEFLRDRNTNAARNCSVAKFLSDIRQVTKSLEDAGHDTGRFLMRFDIGLRSVKKIAAADLIVGIDGSITEGEGPTVITRNVDSNARYPLKRQGVLEKIGPKLNGVTFTSHTLNAIIHAYDCKANSKYIWKAIGGGSMQYSHEFVQFVNSLSKRNIENALAKYKEHQAIQRDKNKRR